MRHSRLLTLMRKRGGSTPLLLDTVTGAVAAYSLRKLRTAYNGPCIRVRRSSDNAEQDIGFVSGVLDTASLLTFCGAGNGFVATWYDQSGNSNNAIQSTATNQPRIVNSGNVDSNNGIVGLWFSAASGNITLTTTDLSSNFSDGQGSAFTVQRMFDYGCAFNNSTVDSYYYYFSTGYLGLYRSSRITGYPASFPIGSWSQLAVQSDSVKYVCHINGVEQTTQAPGFLAGGSHTIGNRTPGALARWKGHISEIISLNISDDDITELINNDQKSYYGIP